MESISNISNQTRYPVMSLNKIGLQLNPSIETDRERYYASREDLQEPLHFSQVSLTLLQTASGSLQQKEFGFLIDLIYDFHKANNTEAVKQCFSYLEKQLSAQLTHDFSETDIKRFLTFCSHHVRRAPYQEISSLLQACAECLLYRVQDQTLFITIRFYQSYIKHPEWAKKAQSINITPLDAQDDPFQTAAKVSRILFLINKQTENEINAKWLSNRCAKAYQNFVKEHISATTILQLCKKYISPKNWIDIFIEKASIDDVIVGISEQPLPCGWINGVPKQVLTNGWAKQRLERELRLKLHRESTLLFPIAAGDKWVQYILSLIDFVQLPEEYTKKTLTATISNQFFSQLISLIKRCSSSQNPTMAAVMTQILVDALPKATLTDLLNCISSFIKFNAKQKRQFYQAFIQKAKPKDWENLLQKGSEYFDPWSYLEACAPVLSQQHAQDLLSKCGEAFLKKQLDASIWQLISRPKCLQKEVQTREEMTDDFFEENILPKLKSKELSCINFNEYPQCTEKSVEKVALQTEAAITGISRFEKDSDYVFQIGGQFFLKAIFERSYIFRKAKGYKPFDKNITDVFEKHLNPYVSATSSTQEGNALDATINTPEPIKESKQEEGSEQEEGGEEGNVQVQQWKKQAIQDFYSFLCTNAPPHWDPSSLEIYQLFFYLVHFFRIEKVDLLLDILLDQFQHSCQEAATLQDLEFLVSAMAEFVQWIEEAGFFSLEQLQLQNLKKKLLCSIAKSKNTPLQSCSKVIRTLMKSYQHEVLHFRSSTILATFVQLFKERTPLPTDSLEVILDQLTINPSIGSSFSDYTKLLQVNENTSLSLCMTNMLFLEDPLCVVPKDHVRTLSAKNCWFKKPEVMLAFLKNIFTLTNIKELSLHITCDYTSQADAPPQTELALEQATIHINSYILPYLPWFSKCAKRYTLIGDKALTQKDKEQVEKEFSHIKTDSLQLAGSLS